MEEQEVEARFFLFGEIEEGIAEDCCRFIMDAIDFGLPEIQIFINSGGGSFASGGAIIQCMSFAKQEGMIVSTLGVGDVQSMALYIFMAGSKGNRFISPYATILSHQGSMSVSGKTHEIGDIVKYLNILKQIDGDLCAKFSSLNTEDADRYLNAPGENYLYPQELIDYGIADRLLEVV
jgi:ATP-dependent Clp protease protease subunit